MDLAKFIAAFSIALFASFFVVEILSLAYPAPSSNYSSCSSSTLCGSLFEKQCGKFSTIGYNSSYYTCQSEVYSSDEYRRCETEAQKTAVSCQKDLASQLQNYQLISFLLYGLIGILFIVAGFLLIGYRSIGSGLSLSGVFIILFSGYISLFSALASYGSVFGGLLGSVEGVSLKTFQILRTILYFVVTALLIVMTYLRLDKPGLKSEED